MIYTGDRAFASLSNNGTTMFIFKFEGPYIYRSAWKRPFSIPVYR